MQTLSDRDSLEQVYILIEQPMPPFLDILIEELSQSGISVCFSINEPSKAAEHSFCLTDTLEGIRFAKAHDMGFAWYSHAVADPEKDNHDKANSHSNQGPEIPSTALSAILNELISHAECVIEGFDEVTVDFIEKLYQRHKGIPWVIAKTPRTIIMELSLDDIDELYELYDDTEIRTQVGSLHEEKTDEIAFQKAYIEKMYGFFGYGFWIIREKSSGHLIGRVGLSHRKDFDGLEMGWLIGEPYRKQGFAEEACLAVIAYAKDILGQDELYAFIAKENVPSMGLASKLGFHPDSLYQISGKEMIRMTKGLQD